MKQHEYKLGEIELKEKNKYKTLGYVQNSNNNNEDHIKAVKGKTEAAYQNMMALVGNENFSMIEMEAIWNVVESCIQQTLIYSGEAWDMTAKNFKEINQVQDSIIKRILKTPDSTPTDARRRVSHAATSVHQTYQAARPSQRYQRSSATSLGQRPWSDRRHRCCRPQAPQSHRTRSRPEPGAYRVHLRSDPTGRAAPDTLAGTTR